MNIPIDLSNKVTLYDIAFVCFSIFSCGLSLITLAWTLYRDAKDIGAIKISLAIHQILHQGLPIDQQDQTQYFSMTVVNIGKRPIQAEKAYITIRSRRFFDKDVNFLLFGLNNTLPRMLEPYEYASVLSGEFNQLFEKKIFIKSIGIIDTAGKYWKASRSEINKLQKQIKTLQKQGKLPINPN